jgi:hypothetical protein
MPALVEARVLVELLAPVEPPVPAVLLTWLHAARLAATVNAEAKAEALMRTFTSYLLLENRRCGVGVNDSESAAPSHRAGPWSACSSALDAIRYGHESR